MTFVPFTKLTAEQAAQAKQLRPHWNESQLHRFAFWITQSGRVSRKPGHHQLTKEAGLEVDKILGSPVHTSANTGPTSTKDQPRRYTGTMPMHLGYNKD